MKRAYVLLLVFFSLLVITSCPVVEKGASFDASKAVPLEIALDVVNNTSSVVSVSIKVMETLRLFDVQTYESLNSNFELNVNESRTESVQLANEKLSGRCVIIYGDRPNYAVTTMKVTVKINQDDELIYSGAEDLSVFFEKDGKKIGDCFFYIDPDKSGTDSFGHLISTTNEKVNGIEKGTVKARLSITDSGFIFSYITD